MFASMRGTHEKIDEKKGGKGHYRAVAWKETEENMKSKRLGVAVGTACVCAMVVACGVAPALAADSASTAAEIVRGGEPDGDVQYPGKEYIVENYEKWDQIAEDYAPEILEYPNGQLVQRTPTEYECPHWMQQSWTISYNTFYLDADNRGCGSCHVDLNSMIEQMDYKHAVIDNDALGTYSDVNQCISCHRDNGDDFGRLMHSIHFNTRNNPKFTKGFFGSCQSCHDATADGKGMQLWDNVKHEVLQGINKVENVEGEFSATQDKVQKMDELYSYDFVHGYYDHMRYACGPLGLDIDLPQSMFDEWEITVDGNVNKPFIAKLPDLVAEAEAAGVVVTKPSKMVCELNPIGGGGIGQVEITGIPTSWLIEKAGGYTEGTNSVRVIRADGSSRSGFDVAALDNGYLVYKIGGEYLDARRGFPVMHWQETYDAQIFSKQISGYNVSSDVMDERVCGQVNQEGAHVNRPNVTICDVPEGLIIENGKPFTFSGYADAFDRKMKTIEFSMDNGETWTSFDVGEVDPAKWIWWNFTFTPEKEGAYVLSVRGTTEDGDVSYRAHEVLVNAKDEMPSEDEIIKVNQATNATDQDEK